MNNDRLRELQKECAEERKEREVNPLSQYSTTQLKKELRSNLAEKWGGSILIYVLVG